MIYRKICDVLQQIPAVGLSTTVAFDWQVACDDRERRGSKITKAKKSVGQPGGGIFPLGGGADSTQEGHTVQESE